MTLWQIILLASIAVLALKLVGYLVPPRVLETPTAARTANLTTVALLSALVVAAGLLAVRAPFILVIVAAAASAALLRMLGWAA